MSETAGENRVLAQISECADTVLRTLGDVGEINILRLAEYLGERSALTYQALGWLAREGKVRYRQNGAQVFVSLMGEESTLR
jgi:hypothetical protein